MKIPLMILFSLIGLVSQAQTAIVAHKSHSGSAADFFHDPNTNFGEPGPQLIQIVRLNDSTYIEVYNSFSGMTYHDTIRKNRKISTYHEDIDSIYQQEYFKHIEYINLKNAADTGRVKAPSLQLQQMIKNTELSPQESDYKPVQEPNPKKKKRSYLLFLFGITGGGLLMFRILNRVFSPQIAS